VNRPTLSWKQILGLIALPAVVAVVFALQPFSDGDGGGAAAGCRGWDTANDACAAALLERTVASDGVQAALGDLKARVESEDVRSSSCHSLAHTVGRAATQRYENVGAAFRAGDQDGAALCGAGYYHGAMEGIVQALSPREVTQRIPGLCTAPRRAGKDAIAHYSCAHGLGHGLHGTQGGTRPALSLCERLQDANERRYCYSGVFMENTRPHGGTDKRTAPSARLRSICPTLSGRARSVCFQRLPQDEAFAGATDFQSIVARCQAVGGTSGLDCYKGLGALAANLGINKGEGAERYLLAVALCRLGQSSAGKARCFMGAAATFVYNERNLAGAQTVCGNADPGVRKSCIRVAAGRFQTLYGGMSSS
jgi:hypothetical protein